MAAARLVAALLLCATGVVPAQDYPTRPLRLIVPFPPGGGADFLARVIGPRVTESWGNR